MVWESCQLSSPFQPGFTSHVGRDTDVNTEDIKFNYDTHQGGRSALLPVEQVHLHPLGNMYPLPPSSHFRVVSTTLFTPVAGTNLCLAKMNACKAFLFNSEEGIFDRIFLSSSWGNFGCVMSSGFANGMMNGASTSDVNNGRVLSDPPHHAEHQVELSLRRILITWLERPVHPISHSATLQTAISHERNRREQRNTPNISRNYASHDLFWTLPLPRNDDKRSL